MSEKPIQLRGMQAIAAEAGVGRKRLHDWIKAAAATDDPFPIYRFGTGPRAQVYSYAHMVQAWMARRPIWTPPVAGGTEPGPPDPPVEYAARSATIVEFTGSPTR